MARRRNYKKKGGRPGRVNRFLGGAVTAMSLASSAIAGVRALKRQLNTEHKKAEFVQSAVSITSTVAYQHLTAIAQGDAISNREGQSMKVTNLLFRARLMYNALGDATQFVRLVLIRDKQQVADTTIVYTDVFQAGVDGIIAPLNSNTAGRFQILYDNVHPLTSNKPYSLMDYDSPMQSHVLYNGTASTDIQRNGLYLLQVSSSAANAPTITSGARITYVDN